LKIVLSAILAILVHGHATAQTAPGDVAPAERRILMDFFAATGGSRWTKRDGWGTSTPVCDWRGVRCDFVDGDASRPFVASVSLPLNDLEGRLPASLADLPRLQHLDVTGNRLSGPVPEGLLQRWDDHRLELSIEGNAFANTVVNASVESSAGGVLCAPDEDVHFRVDLDPARGRAVSQSIRCESAGSRTTYCLVKEGTPGSFARFSRALKRLQFTGFKPAYEYPFSAATHGGTLTTTATWGDGSRKAVETDDGQGPLDVWTAQQLFLRLIAETSWERETRKPKCDFEK
jgi:hypothetical protein